VTQSVPNSVEEANSINNTRTSRDLRWWHETCTKSRRESWTTSAEKEMIVMKKRLS